MKLFQTHVVTHDQSGLTIETLLKQELHYSGRKLQKLTRQKGLFLNKKAAFLKKQVKENDILRVLLSADADYGVLPEDGPLTICYEDNHLFALNKPPYQLVHPTGWTSSKTLANYLAGHLKKRGVTITMRPIHRLDRDTSGCVLFAKSDHSQFALEAQLKSGQLKRTYTALVQGVVQPSSGTIDEPIGEHPTHPNRRAVSAQGDCAVTHYKTIEALPNASLLEVVLETGRTHQIRVHLAHIGYPIIGDAMYGSPSTLIKRQALHASAITFQRPDDGKTITISAPLPDDFTQALTHCRELDPQALK